MKKFLSLSLIGSLALLLSSCLKDDLYENQRVGIQDNSTPAVGFSRGSSDTTAFATSIGPSTSAQNFTSVEIAIDNSRPLASDVTVTIAPNPGLITPSSGYVALPAGAITLPTTVVIPAGKQSVVVPIVFLNTSVLSLNDTYAIGLTITSASNGVAIRNDRKFAIVQVNVKNKYDGKYIGKGYGFLGANTTAPYLFKWNCDFDINLSTTGANSVDMDAQPLFRNGATTYGFGNVIPQFTFDPVTDKVVAVTPSTHSPANTISFQFPVDGNDYDSRYDPATQTIFVKYGLNNTTWRVIDTLTYCAER